MAATLSVRINSCGVILCEPTWQWDPRPSTLVDFDLWFVWAGVGTLATPDVTTAVQRGKLFLFRPHGTYVGRQDKQRRLGVCYLHFDFLDARGRVVRPTAASLPPLHSDMRDADDYERLLRRVVGLHRRETSASRAAAGRLLESVLLSIPLDRLPDDASAADRSRETRIADVMRHIRENPGTLFSVADLAERSAYAIDHFTKLFTQVAGVGPKEFCIRVRMERATHLLRETDLGVEQISAALGYGDVFFFSRQFKSRTGVAPTEWRWKHR